MVNRHERVGHRLGRLAGGDDVDELARTGHVDGIGRDERVAHRPQLPVERLDHEEPDPLEPGGLDRGHDRADDAGQLHRLSPRPWDGANPGARSGRDRPRGRRPYPATEAPVRGEVLGHLPCSWGITRW